MVSQTLPEEFSGRTVYLHYALPVSKSSIYIGKYVASYIVILMIIAIGFGCALLCTSMRYPGTDLSAVFVLKAYGVSALTAFALSSMVYAMSSKGSKGSTLRGFLVIVISVPLLLIIPSFLSPYLPSLDVVFDNIGLIAAYLPMSGFDVALLMVGSDGFALSPNGFVFVAGEMGGPLSFEYPLASVSLPIACAIYAVWGVVFMVRGLHRINRREI